MNNNLKHMNNNLFYLFKHILLRDFRDIIRIRSNFTLMIETNAKTFGRRRWKIMHFSGALPLFTLKEKSIVYSAEDHHLGNNSVITNKGTAFDLVNIQVIVTFSFSLNNDVLFFIRANGYGTL